MVLPGRSTAELFDDREQHQGVKIQTANSKPLIVHRDSWVRRRRPATSNGFTPIASDCRPCDAMGAILGESSCKPTYDFLPTPTRKVSAERSRDAFGFTALTFAEVGLEEFNQLAVPLAMEALATSAPSA